MERKGLQILLLCIFIGVVIGSIIGILSLFGIVSSVDMFYKLCIGGIVVIIDGVVLWSMLQTYMNIRIDKTGEKSIAKIENVSTCIVPNEINKDEWIRKSRFVIKASYDVCGKKYTKEFPPTNLISERELYPHKIEKGEYVPIKYLKTNPYFSLIDIDKIKLPALKEQKKTKVLLFMLIFVLTTFYLFSLCIL